MPSRWRRFWRVFFLLEKAQRRREWSKRAIHKHPELRHFESEPLAWRDRVRMAGTVAIAGLVVVALTYATWLAFMGASWLIELWTDVPRLGNAAQVTRAMSIREGAMKIGIVACILIQWALWMLLAVVVVPRLHLRACRRALLRRGIPICTRCGYEPGSWTDRCPECGRPINRPAASAK